MQNIDPNLHDDASMSESPFFQPQTSPKNSLFRGMSSRPVPPYGAEPEAGDELPDQAEPSEANYANQKSFFDPVGPDKAPSSPDPFKSKKAFASGNFQSATKSENEAFQHLSESNSFFGRNPSSAPSEGLDDEGDLPEIATADLPMTGLTNSLTSRSIPSEGVFQEAAFPNSQQAFFDQGQASSSSSQPSLDSKVVNRAREYQKELASTPARGKEIAPGFAPASEEPAVHEQGHSLSSTWPGPAGLSPVSAKAPAASPVTRPKSGHSDLADIQEAALQSKASLEAAADRVASNPELEERSRKLLEEKRKADMAMMKKMQAREETVEAEEIARRQELQRQQRERQQAILREEELDRLNRERFFNNNLEVPSQQTEENFTKNSQGLAFESLPTLPSEKADRAAANALEQLERQTSPSLADSVFAPSPFSSTQSPFHPSPSSVAAKEEPEFAGLSKDSWTSTGTRPSRPFASDDSTTNTPAPSLGHLPSDPFMTSSSASSVAPFASGEEASEKEKKPSQALPTQSAGLMHPGAGEAPAGTVSPVAPASSVAPLSSVSPVSPVPSEKAAETWGGQAVPLKIDKAGEAPASTKAPVPADKALAHDDEKPVRKHMDPLDIVDQINEATTTSEGGKRDPFEALDKLEAMGVSLESSAFSLRKHTDYYNAQQDIDVSGDEVANKNTQDWVAPWVQAARDQGRTVRQGPMGAPVGTDQAKAGPAPAVSSPELKEEPKAKSKFSLPHFGSRRQEEEPVAPSPAPAPVAKPSFGFADKAEQAPAGLPADKALPAQEGAPAQKNQAPSPAPSPSPSPAPSHEAKSLAALLGFGKKEGKKVAPKESAVSKDEAVASQASEKEAPKPFFMDQKEPAPAEVQTDLENEPSPEPKKEADKGFFGLKGKFSLGKNKHEEKAVKQEKAFDTDKADQADKVEKDNQVNQMSKAGQAAKDETTSESPTTLAAGKAESLSYWSKVPSSDLASSTVPVSFPNPASTLKSASSTPSTPSGLASAGPAIPPLAEKQAAPSDLAAPAKKPFGLGEEFKQKQQSFVAEDLTEDRHESAPTEAHTEKGPEQERTTKNFPGAPWLQNIAVTRPPVPKASKAPAQAPAPSPLIPPTPVPGTPVPEAPISKAPLAKASASEAVENEMEAPVSERAPESLAPERPAPATPDHADDKASTQEASEASAPEVPEEVTQESAKEPAETSAQEDQKASPVPVPAPTPMPADDNISWNFMEQLKAQKTPVTYQFVDCLINVLPNMGAFSPVDARGTAAMLDLLKLQGCQALWICPTFDPLTMNLGQFLDRRQEAFDEIKGLLEEREMDYLLGAEVVLREGLTDLPNLQVLSMGNKMYMAVTLGKDGHLEDYHIQLLAALRAKYQVTPVLMHMQDTELLKRKETRTVLRSLGCRFAMDISAFNESGFGRKRNLASLVNDGEIDFMGTGASDMLRFQPIIRPIMDKAIKSIHTDAYQRILDGSLASFR